jgi:hypothetical protein
VDNSELQQLTPALDLRAAATSTKPRTKASIHTIRRVIHQTKRAVLALRISHAVLGTKAAV